jgi:hypothetical protein
VIEFRGTQVWAKFEPKVKPNVNAYHIKLDNPERDKIVKDEMDVDVKTFSS